MTTPVHPHALMTLISSAIGVAAGAVQGYFGGWTDLLFQRLIEIWTSDVANFAPWRSLGQPVPSVLPANEPSCARRKWIEQPSRAVSRSGVTPFSKVGSFHAPV